MTPHAAIRLLVHRIKARRLHGVHSPFVFGFSKDIIARKDIKIPVALTAVNGVSDKYRRYIAAVQQQYGYHNIIIVNDTGEVAPHAADIVIFNNKLPGNWVLNFNHFRAVRQPECIFIITGIHHSRRHTAKWRRLCKPPKRAIEHRPIWHRAIVVSERIFKKAAFCY